MAATIFNKVEMPNVKKSTFDLSHERKFSMKPYGLVPCLVLECLPGDKFRINTSQLVRFLPMSSPVMHRFDFYVHMWYVPNHTLWANWEKFITGGPQGDEEPTFPFINLTTEE